MHKAQLDEPTMRSLMKQAETRNAVLPVVNAAMRHSDDEEQLLTRADHLRNRAQGEAKERAVDAKKVQSQILLVMQFEHKPSGDHRQAKCSDR